MRVVAVATGLVLVCAVAAGCSSSPPAGPTAEQQVCTARSELKTAYDTMASDITAGSFGTARNDLAGVSTAVSGLATAQSGLAAEKRIAIQPQVVALQTTVQTLKESTTLAELGAGLDTAKTQFQSLIDTVAATAGCS